MSRSPVLPNEHAPLLPTSPLNGVSVTISADSNRNSAPIQKKSNKVLIKVVSFAGGAGLQPVVTGFNSWLYDLLGYAGVGSLTTSFQGMMRNVGTGILMAGGVELGKALGEEDLEKASEVVVASYVLTAMLTLLSSALYGGTYFVFPYLASEKIANPASGYFLWGEIGNWPTLALSTCGQIPFQLNDWKSPLLSSLANRLPTMGLAYLLAVTAGMGANGISIANGVTPWVAYIPLELWLHRRQFDLIKKPVTIKSSCQKHLWPMCKLGAKMGLQKFTEFGNVLAVTNVLGLISEENLTIILPSIQFMSFFSVLAQGMGLAGNMLLSTLHAALMKLSKKETLTEEDVEALRKYQAEIRSIVFKCLIAGALINGILAVVMFFARSPISNLFLPENASSKVHSNAETALWINGIGLFADSSRIVAGNLLNTYGNITIPNLISLILMTVIGVTISYLSSMRDKSDAVVNMFVIRTAMIFLASLINTLILYHAMESDDKMLREKIAKGNFPVPAELATPGFVTRAKDYLGSCVGVCVGKRVGSFFYRAAMGISDVASTAAPLIDPRSEVTSP